MEGHCTHLACVVVVKHVERVVKHVERGRLLQILTNFSMEAGVNDLLMWFDDLPTVFNDCYMINNIRM